MTIPMWAWIAWLLAFLLLEILALRSKAPGDTLSENVWDWASVKGRGRMFRLRRFLLLTLLVWLTVHLMTGGAV